MYVLTARFMQIETLILNWQQ